MIVYFDALLSKTLNVIRLDDDDYGIYCSHRDRRNSFGTPLAARGTQREIAQELDRVSLGRGVTTADRLPQP